MLKCWNKSSSRSTKAGGQKGETACYRFDCDVSSNRLRDTVSNRAPEPKSINLQRSERRPPMAFVNFRRNDVESHS